MSVSRVVCSFAVSMTLGATSAIAQYGPYGSPELIRMPQSAPQYATPAYGVVPVSANYLAQPAPAPPMPEGGSTMLVPQENRAIAQPPSVVNQMLEQADCYGTAPSPIASGCSSGSCGSYTRAMDDADCGGSYDICGPMMAECCYPWFVSLRGLVMGRNETDNVWTSYEWDNEANQVLKTNDVETSWEGGGEITFGWRNCCAGMGLEVTYWTLGNFSGSALACDVGTPFQTGLVEFESPVGWVGPTSAFGIFMQAQEHRLYRENEIHDLELNVFSTRLVDPSCSPLTIDWNAGIRWFRFRENLAWDALAGTHWDPDVTWGYDGGRYQAHLEDDVKNDLIGFQFGFDADMRLGHRCKLFASPKFGIYNNHIRHHFELYRGDGVSGECMDNDGNLLGCYPFDSSDDVLSFITELDLGLECQITHRISATIGYRVLVATDVALADNQIPFYWNDVPEAEDIDSNNDLILHGAFAGLNLNF